MASLEEEEKNFESNPKKWILKTLIWVTVLSAFFATGFYLVSWFEEGAQVAKETYGARAAKTEYEWFKQQHADYKAIGKKIEQSEKTIQSYKEDLGPREKWDFSDKDELSRLNAVKLGLEQQQDDVAAKYNAKSKMKTRNVFKTNDLPYELK